MLSRMYSQPYGWVASSFHVTLLSTIRADTSCLSMLVFDAEKYF